MSFSGARIPVDPRFVEVMDARLGNESGLFLDSLDEPPATSVYLNERKPAPGHFQAARPVQWTKRGFFLDQRPSFTFDPLFHAGAYYVQEASSMFIEQVISQVLDPAMPIMALDLCAAPGGKSAVMLSTLPEGSLLVANEVIRSRWEVLQYNLDKWGVSNVISTQSDPSRLDWDGLFDLVVVDAPCSGEGMFRKDPESRMEWSPQNVDLCSARQRRILPEAYRLLKPGGLLVYCTCTFNSKENLDQTVWVANEFHMDGLGIELDGHWNIEVQVSNGVTGYQFWPHRMEGEGFFCAILRKPDDAEISRNDSRKGRRLSQSHEIKLDDFIDIDAAMGATKTYLRKERIFVLQTALDPDVLGDLSRHRVGTLLGERKGSSFVPAHALALSVNVSRVWSAVDVDKEQAILFLRKESPVLDLTTGWHLVQYKGHGLGWLKQTPSGIRNYLPTHLRIRSSG